MLSRCNSQLLGRLLTTTSSNASSSVIGSGGMTSVIRNYSKQEKETKGEPVFGKKKKISTKNVQRVPRVQIKPAPAPEQDISAQQKLENLASHSVDLIKPAQDSYYTPSFQKLGMLGNIHDLVEDWDNVKGIDLNRKDKLGLSEATKLLNKKEHEEANIQFSRHGGDGTPFPRLPNNNPPLIAAHHHYNGTYSRALLNDRKTLNSINATTLNLLEEYLKNVIKNDRVSCFSIHTSTPGIIHSAGTDLVSLFEKRDTDIPQKFFRKLYKVMYLLSVMPKPHINILDGLAVGSGAALTGNSGIRVVTENAIMAFPEAAMGFYPDCGSIRFLAKLEGYLGLYMALTGRRLGAQELLECGAGNFFIRTNQVPLMEDTLGQLPMRRPDRMFKIIDMHTDSWEGLSEHTTHYETYKEAIDRCFSALTVEEIIANLRKETGATQDWARRCIQNMERMSPLGLKVTNALYQFVSRGRGITDLADQLEMEYNITCALLREGSDFWEGIRANLVYNRAPQWRYPTLESVTDDVIDEIMKYKPAQEFALRRMPNNSERFEELVHDFYDEHYMDLTPQDEIMFRTYKGDAISDKHSKFIEEYYKQVPSLRYTQMRQFEDLLDNMDPEDLYNY